MPGGERKKIVPVDAILTSGQPESCQVPFFNPAQDGYFADAAVLGDDAGGEIFRVWVPHVYPQVLPP